MRCLASFPAGLRAATARLGGRRGALGALALLLLLWPGAAQATDWLVLLVDRSNSIDAAELRLQRQAYVQVLMDPEVLAVLADTMVALVEFDTRAEVVVSWDSPAEVARRYARPRPDGLRGQTAIGAALSTALGLLDGREGRQVIDVSGDGKENRDARLLRKTRAKLVARGVLINGLALPSAEEPDLEAFYSADVANGFVMAIAQRADFLAALKRKLMMEMTVARGAMPGGEPPS